MSRPLEWSLLSRFGAVVFGAALLVAAPRIARAGASFVIPPGREPLVLRLLCETDGAPLPAECRCDGVRIEPTYIRAKYACGSSADPIVVELHHPAGAERASASTAKFGVVTRGALPPPLLPALLSQIRAAESAWLWVAPTMTGSSAGERTDNTGAYPLILALIGVAALSLSWWAASSRPPARGSGGPLSG